MSEAAKTPAADTPPAPGTPEHDAKMVAVADARMGVPPTTPSTPAAKPTKPAGVPDKFWDAEKGEVRLADLAKSYGELETKLGQQPPAAKPADPPKPAPSVYAQKALLADKGIAVDEIEKLTPEQVKAKYDELSKPAADPAKVAAESKGVDFKVLGDEYAKNGKLSDETYADLAKKGFDKTTVDTYIAGQAAIAEKYDAVGMEAAGGEERFKAMAAWASRSVSPADLATFNDAVSSMDESRMKLAVAGMRARFEAAEGAPPKLALRGGNAADTSDEGFASLAEQKVAQSDPRYKKDPAYRDQVIRRIANSNFQTVQALS
jgi:hypothetical protein